MELLKTLPENLLVTSAYIGLFVFIFLVAKWVKDLFTPYKLNKELAEHDNFAISLTMSGYYIAVALIYAGQVAGYGVSFQSDIINVALYSLLGVLVLNLCRWINDKFILRTFCNIEKLTKEQDVGVGIVQFAVYVATGFIASGALSGEGSIWTFFGFFFLGQLCLIIFSVVYNLIAPFNLYEQLEQKNMAAATAFAGTIIALGLIIMNGVSGDFVAWSSDLTSFALTVFIAFVCLPLFLWVTDRLIIPGKSIRIEIVEDKNLAAGVLEATIAVSFALVLIKLL